ncbi:helix-turn-helix domain-containing protein [Nonomuraea sp. N2-4H]|uniref:helix-turn-helix domain-containing protein n=1 Tax=Nonomuraea sp. N2-4H TaxID=3128898 RepID=UPI0032465FC1
MTDSKPMRADARRNRARILAAAEEVFAERGASASTEEVAARAGVAIGTVFRHFPTKRDLLAAIMKDLRRRLHREGGGAHRRRRSGHRVLRVLHVPRRQLGRSRCRGEPARR